MSVYWLVWNEGGGAPTVKHDTRESAEHEAERLARAHRGQRFTVLQALASVIVSDLQWDRAYVNDDGIPF